MVGGGRWVDWAGWEVREGAVGGRSNKQLGRWAAWKVDKGGRWAPGRGGKGEWVAGGCTHFRRETL